MSMSLVFQRKRGVYNFLREIASILQSINLGGLSIRAVVVSPCVLSQSSRKPAQRDTADRAEGEGGYYNHRAAVDIRLIPLWVETKWCKSCGDVYRCSAACIPEIDRTMHLFVPTLWTVHAMRGSADCKMPFCGFC